MKRTSLLLALALGTVSVSAHVRPEPPASEPFSPLFARRLEVGIAGMDRPDEDRIAAGRPFAEIDPVATPLSANPVSFCVASACMASFCLGSACMASKCLGSACLNSGCGGSACVVSLCGGSACAASVCGGSACLGSACAGSACAPGCLQGGPDGPGELG
jgi:hypothetical protein